MSWKHFYLDMHTSSLSANKEKHYHHWCISRRRGMEKNKGRSCYVPDLFWANFGRVAESSGVCVGQGWQCFDHPKEPYGFLSFPWECQHCLAREWLAPCSKWWYQVHQELKSWSQCHKGFSHKTSIYRKVPQDLRPNAQWALPHWYVECHRNQEGQSSLSRVLLCVSRHILHIPSEHQSRHRE